MKLAHKLTMAFVAGTSVILATNGYFRVKREVALFESDRAFDHVILGRALRPAFAAIWRAEGLQKALDALADATAHEGRIHARWISKDDPLRSTLSTETQQLLSRGDLHHPHRCGWGWRPRPNHVCARVTQRCIRGFARDFGVTSRRAALHQEDHRRHRDDDGHPGDRLRPLGERVGPLAGRVGPCKISLRRRAASVTATSPRHCTSTAVESSPS